MLVCLIKSNCYSLIYSSLIESQQKFDFFCSDIMPKVLGTLFDCPYSYFMLLLENYYPLMEGLNPPGTPPPQNLLFEETANLADN